MTPGVRIQNMGGAQAVILHRPHPNVVALQRQLAAIGLQSTECWPDLDPGVMGADFVFFDADMGHDDQFPWPAGAPPMPMIALIGSEAPGRIEWALRAGAHAHLLKPVLGHGVYSALLIAREAFTGRLALGAEIAALKARLEARQTIVRAVTMLAARGKTEDEAYAQLRQMAMAWRVSFEEAAGRVAGRSMPGKDGDDLCIRR